MCLAACSTLVTAAGPSPTPTGPAPAGEVTLAPNTWYAIPQEQGMPAVYLVTGSNGGRWLVADIDPAAPTYLRVDAIASTSQNAAASANTSVSEDAPPPRPVPTEQAPYPRVVPLPPPSTPTLPDIENPVVLVTKLDLRPPGQVKGTVIEYKVRADGTVALVVVEYSNLGFSAVVKSWQLR